MDTLVSLSMVMLISVIAIGIVISIGLPVIDLASNSAEIKNAEDDLKFIDTYVRSVAAEGAGAVRIYKFSSPKDFESIPGEDTIQFSHENQGNFIDYLTRKTTGNFVYTSGANVDCKDDGLYYTLENERLKAYFRKISGQMDTANIVAKITQKTSGTDVFIGNSSVIMDNDPATSAGAGYTEISFPGTRLPECQIHAFVNSALDYDIYYRLYSGADFIIAEVRNIG